MKTYTIIKIIRREWQKDTIDLYPQKIGPFTDRKLAEQTLANVGALPTVATATIRVDETED